MATEEPKVQVRIKSRVVKFAEGADPAKDQPFEVLEHEHVLEGEEARQFLIFTGGDQKCR